jgi:putative ABC transport system permease protein
VVRRSLVVLQLALAVSLVLGAGVLLRSLANLYGVDAGINVENVLTLRLTPSAVRYSDPVAVVSYYDQVLERVRALPGVTAVGAVSNLPLTGGMNGWSFLIEGRPAANTAEAPAADIAMFTPGYAEAIGLEVVRGRDMSAADRAESRPVVLVSEAFAQRYFPGEDVIGKRFKVFVESWPYMEVVGVVRDIRQYGLDRDVYPVWYVPHAQGYKTAYTTFRPMSLVVRTAGDPAALAAAVRTAVRSVDGTTAIERIRTLREVRDASVGTRRFTLLLITVFALVAVFLGGVGVYGVVAWSVTAKMREIGVRMALGARAGSVLGSVLAEALLLAGAGIVAGLALAALSSAALKGLVFGVRPMDPLTCAAVSLVLLGAAFAAAFGPALRATRVDPLATLRAD